MLRKGFSVAGRVQGVGFRPFVFRLAARYALSGNVRNAPEGVLIEVQGSSGDIEAFSKALRDELPPLAQITKISERDLSLADDEGFHILASDAGLAHEVLISPDTATCADCLNDIAAPDNQRYRYPFTNCTNCGPRYTITAQMPYDRANTSMACFSLCPVCEREYNDPLDRRFHAQPNACPICGPQIWLAETPAMRGELGSNPCFEKTLPEYNPHGESALRELARRIMSGSIAAVKGLGGFHLVCDATSQKAVERLRASKNRPHKPLAIMVKDTESTAALVHLDKAARKLLESLERPIVLCPRKAGSLLQPLLSPDTQYIGVMLPYTPLHHILLGDCSDIAKKENRHAALVMTSGNRGGEPIALGNREALSRLSAIADCFLLHDRDILIRTDDSVVRPVPPLPALKKDDDPCVMYMRRARGFVPLPLGLAPAPEGKSWPCVLGLGAELKNTICISRGNEAFVSQHIGDLQNIETSAFQQEISRHLPDVLQVKPAALVFDAHPDFIKQSPDAGSDLPHALLPHHFAHASAVLAENRHEGPALVLALDGTGFAPASINPDKSLWGGELILAHPAAKNFSRLGSMSQIPLPGGEAAIRSPWRIAHALLLQLGLLPEGQNEPNLPWLPEQASAASVIPQMQAKKLNTPCSSSAGRLFDAVSALLGVCLDTTYEGQAAIRLEAAQNPGEAEAFSGIYAQPEPALPCPVCDMGNESSPRFMLDTHTLFKAVYEQSRQGKSAAQLSRAFHWSFAEGLAELALAGSRASGTKYVGLSGGVMQNMTLHLLLLAKLRERELIPLAHRQLPANDGCISYGQAAWGVRHFL